jgi:hypothetical protein
MKVDATLERIADLADCDAIGRAAAGMDVVVHMAADPNGQQLGECSDNSIAQLVLRCIAASKSVRTDVFFGTSVNPYPQVDIEHAWQLLGCEPQDRAQDCPVRAPPAEEPR